MSKLLPCPFCGSADINTEGPCYDAFMCNACGVSQYDQPGHAEAIEAWNTRANQSEIATAMLDALVQALIHIEVDETTHGRNFAAGNVVRSAIAKAEGRS